MQSEGKPSRQCLVRHVNCYARREARRSPQMKTQLPHASGSAQPETVDRRQPLRSPSKHAARVRSAFSCYRLMHIIASLFACRPPQNLRRPLIDYSNYEFRCVHRAAVGWMGCSLVWTAYCGALLYLMRRRQQVWTRRFICSICARWTSALSFPGVQSEKHPHEKASYCLLFWDTLRSCMAKSIWTNNQESPLTKQGEGGGGQSLADWKWQTVF